MWIAYPESIEEANFDWFTICQKVYVLDHAARVVLQRIGAHERTSEHKGQRDAMPIAKD